MEVKRFITYVYEYRDEKKIQNAGFIRVDVRGCRLYLMLNIKSQKLKNEKAKLLLLYRRKELIEEISLDEVLMCNGVYNKRIILDLKEEEISLENIVGISLKYEDGTYMASCWKEGKEELIAKGALLPSDELEESCLKAEESMLPEEVLEIPTANNVELQVANMDTFVAYGKINLNQIYDLPKPHWHYGNNSFLIHGFWNYGYLVLKESVEENIKRISLGVPGIFEQPEMVMATYFGFPSFKVLPLQVETLEIGQWFRETEVQMDDMKNQQTKDGTFGCWFVDL